MYHNQPDRVELHDDVVGVKQSKLEVKEGKPVLLHMTYVLRPDREYVAPENGVTRVHTTNGVQHRWYEVGAEDPALTAIASDERVSPILNGENRQMIHDDAGDPFVTSAALTDANTLQSDAPNSAYETRRYAEDLSYRPDEFQTDAEGKRVREQQRLIDESIPAMKEAKNANTVRSEKKNEEKKEK